MCARVCVCLAFWSISTLLKTILILKNSPFHKPFSWPKAEHNQKLNNCEEKFQLALSLLVISLSYIYIYIYICIGLVSLFNEISVSMGYLIAKQFELGPLGSFSIMITVTPRAPYHGDGGCLKEVNITNVFFPSMTLNCIWWWVSCSGSLVNVEYFIIIPFRSTHTLRGSTC